MKFIAAFALMFTAFTAKAHTHYCDHHHNSNGTITWDCGQAQNASRESDHQHHAQPKLLIHATDDNSAVHIVYKTQPLNDK